MATPGVQVVIFGHSFIGRLQNFISENPMHVNLSLDPARFQVKCIGLGGLRLVQRRRLHSFDNTLAGKDLVFIDIGSNVLCNPLHNPEQFALDKGSYASFLVTGLEINKVVISQILPRAIVPFPEYNNHVIRASVAIEHVLTTCDYPILFWKHRRIWNPRNDIYCHDGVHLSHEVGYPKYLRSLRDCTFRVLNWN